MKFMSVCPVLCSLVQILRGFLHILRKCAIARLQPLETLLCLSDSFSRHEAVHCTFISLVVHKFFAHAGAAQHHTQNYGTIIIFQFKKLPITCSH